MKFNAVVGVAGLAALDFAAAFPFPASRKDHLPIKAVRTNDLATKAAVVSVPLKIYGRGNADYQVCLDIHYRNETTNAG